MASKSRNVNGYVKRVDAAMKLKVAIERQEAALRERLAHKRARMERLVAESKVLYGRMTGGQIAEARRLTTMPRVEP